MRKTGGTVQVASGNALRGISGRLTELYRQMRQTRQTWTLSGFGFKAQYERIEITSDLLTDGEKKRSEEKECSEAH